MSTTVKRSKPPSAAGQGHVPALEGLRGVLAVGVVAAHSAIYSGATAAGWNNSYKSNTISLWLGPIYQVTVPIFCAMAGLLLYRQFADSAIRGAKMQPVRPYLWRRALRILPLYWVVVVVGLVTITGNQPTSLWGWIRPLGFMQIYQKNAYGNAAIPNGMIPTWSLSSEAVFYLVLPVLALLLAGLAALVGRRSVENRAKAVYAGLALLLVFNVGWVAWIHRKAAGQWPLQWFWLPSLIGYFAVGMAVAALASRAGAPGAAPSRAYQALRRAKPGLWVLAGVTFVLSGIPALVGKDPAELDYQNIPHGLTAFAINLVCAGSVITAIAIGGGRQHVLDSKPVAFLGRISYGVYLWHEIVLTLWFQETNRKLGSGDFWLVYAVALSITLAVATVSHYVIELPGRRLRTRLGKASTGFVVPDLQPVPSVPAPVPAGAGAGAGAANTA